MARSKTLLISAATAFLGLIVGASATYYHLEHKHKIELLEFGADLDLFRVENSMEVISAIDKGDFKGAYSKANYHLAVCVFTANNLKLEPGHVGQTYAEALKRSEPQRTNPVFLEEELKIKSYAAQMRKPQPQ